MVTEYFEAEDLASQAQQSLNEASKDLAQLANYCENKYKEGLEPKKSTQEFPSGRKIHGGESIQQTAEFAIQALSAISVNVRVLADDFMSKMAVVEQDLDYLTSEIGWMSLQIEFGEERMARRQIRRLCQKKQLQESHSAVSKVPSPKLKPYAKTVLDVSTLDSIGANGVKKPKLRLSIKKPSFDEKPEMKTLHRSYTATLGRNMSRASALTASTATLNRMKMPAMPKIPASPKEPSIDETKTQEKNDEYLDLSSKSDQGRRLSLLPPMPDEVIESGDVSSSSDDYGSDGNEELDDPLPTPPAPPGAIKLEAHLKQSTIREQPDEINFDRDLSLLLHDMDDIYADINSELNQLDEAKTSVTEYTT
ncbi:hypothetical protein TCAL_15714 [Tigriopus californicus]|uniref:Uncharacterized protein n=1 Tax=Tigriopus californicus TaxID=6832 RepID=A0A553P6T2_TIGCA|nr:ABI gene family member 3-like [Tigriopus californicus]TRY73387.1 hypothetical protein TCAL_15714 [Tigriopus californicus]